MGCKAVTSREVSLELSQENIVNVCPDLPLSCIQIFEVNMEAEGKIVGGAKEPAGMGLEYRGEQLGARSIMKTSPK